MHERHVIGVAVVIDALEKITRPDFGRQHFEDAVRFHVRIAWKYRRSSNAKICEDQAEIFLSWITFCVDLAGKGSIFRGLLGALAGAVEQPTVIHAADA